MHLHQFQYLFIVTRTSIQVRRASEFNGTVVLSLENMYGGVRMSELLISDGDTMYLSLQNYQVITFRDLARYYMV